MFSRENHSILIPLASSQHNLYDIYLLLRVQCLTSDDGHRNCPKHIEFHSINKFEKLVHLVGFTTRIFRTLITNKKRTNIPINERTKFVKISTLQTDGNSSLKNKLRRRRRINYNQREMQFNKQGVTSFSGVSSSLI